MKSFLTTDGHGWTRMLGKQKIQMRVEVRCDQRKAWNNAAATIRRICERSLWPVGIRVHSCPSVVDNPPAPAAPCPTPGNNQS
jgi:hypothetical protein